MIIEPMVVANIDPSRNYVGFQGDFTFDSDVVTFSPPFVEAAGLTGTNWNVSANILPVPATGIRILRISSFSLDKTPLNGSGTLFNLRMVRVSNTPGAMSVLAWQPPPDNFIFIDGDLGSFDTSQNNGLITITGATPAPGVQPLR